jgi:hypothetical protein
MYLPDGEKICKLFLVAEIAGENNIHQDGWTDGNN